MRLRRGLKHVVLAATALAVCCSASRGATCNRACLLGHAKQFNANMVAHAVEKTPLAADAQIRENTKTVKLSDSKWNAVTKILSEGVYADPILGNVIEHVTAETTPGKTVYIGTRLKVVDNKITEVEINFDDRPEVNVKNLVPSDPFFTTLVPVEERSTREQLAKIINSYFQGLTDHKPIEAEYDPRCDRYHSGNRITHNARNGVENSGDVGCYESNLGAKPWGPANEIRIALIDPERGIVIGYSLLEFPNNHQMQINEVFKILQGRVRMIDNLGLMGEGIKTSGFTK
jgi:hypothetical protein